MKNVIPPPDPRHDPAQALAWIDALEPIIRACRLRSRSMGVEILVRALRDRGFEAKVVSRALSSSMGSAFSIRAPNRSEGFVYLPSVQGQLLSFDGFQGEQAWAVALSNRHAAHIAKSRLQRRSPGDNDLRLHTRYLAPNEKVLGTNPLQAKSKLDGHGHYKLTPADGKVLETVVSHLAKLDLPPPPLPACDDRLVSSRAAPAGPSSEPPPPTALEQRLLKVCEKPPFAGLDRLADSAVAVAASVASACRQAGASARVLHRYLTYRGAMEVFDIQRVAVEFQVPGHDPEIICVSAPGGWEGLTAQERQCVQTSPADRLHKGQATPVEGLDFFSVSPSQHVAITSAISSYLMNMTVDQAASAAPSRAPRF